jgi:hypothetical protein
VTKPINRSELLIVAADCALGTGKGALHGVIDLASSSEPSSLAMLDTSAE